MNAADVILEDYPLPKGVDLVNTQEKIKKANERIKELELLIHHWEKANESRSTSPPDQEHAE